jgi:peptidyl-prolyl cis-trans isomerase A (cyclophilin A)
VKKTLATILALALCAAACTDGGADDDDDDDDIANADAAAHVDSAIAGGTEVVLETTLGNMVVRLADAEMPVTTANFLTYVDSGFYDDTLVHRVIDDWVIQGGGYSSGLVPKSPNPPIVLETSSAVGHVHGAISMARTSDPNSATSQWFIVDWPTNGTPPQPAQLDGQYAAFGIVIEGLDVLEAITQVTTGSQGGLTDVPAVEVLVTAARRR